MENKQFTIIARKIKKDLLYLSLAPIDGRIIKFNAGQFVKITSLKKEEEPKSRFYSVASIPSDKNFEFIIKIVGRFTNHLSSLEKGEILEIEGPYGHFAFANQNKTIFIAGGVGIAPVISILRHINHEKINGEFYLFYSNKTSDIPFYDELTKIEESNKHIKLIFTITGEKQENWSGEHGRINLGMILKYVDNSNTKNYSVYICGPLNMALSLKKDLSSGGFVEKNIFLEAWG
ncbi:MAG: FAD-dependent oxidoreductase [Candidatus Micrarchaeia archaeon]